ncbi:pyridoxamine 5'-phosphate oxidase family protein [Anaerosporobacter sp.]
MEEVRYKQRNCSDRQKIEAFLEKTRIGVIGMQGETYPYTVPVNYIWHNGGIYFHGMGSGKKNELLMKEPQVSFTVYEEVGTVKDPVPCHADTAYMSVMIFGYAKKVEDYTESAQVLQLIVEKYLPGFYKSKIPSTVVEHYRSSHDKRSVAVYKIEPEEITAKENVAKEDELFES